MIKALLDTPFIQRVRARTCPFFDRFIPVMQPDLLQVKDFRGALNAGTTLTTRFWVSLFSLSLGLQLLFANPSPGYLALFLTVPIPYWSGALISSGALMMWRVLAGKPRPVVAWFSNSFTCWVWTMVVVSRFFALGGESLVSSPTVIMIMSAWVLLRTEATHRDGETA